jgi:hypothetical protein
MFDGKHRIGRSISRSSGKVRVRINEEPAKVLIALYMKLPQPVTPACFWPGSSSSKNWIPAKNLPE